MRRKPDISIVILNYNSIDFLRESLSSIAKSKLDGLTVETIIVDNASTDDSVAVIRKEYKKTKLIASKKNRGFAGGNNLAINKTYGKYVLFLNPDTILEPDALGRVYKYMEEHKDVGAATCRLELASGEPDNSTHRGFPTPVNAFFYFSGISRLFPTVKAFTGYTQGWKLNDPNPHEVEVISGAFFFVRRKAAKEVGWWDEDYFWYGEDIEFSYRLKESGWKIMFLPGIKTLHYKGVTSGIKKHTKKVSKATKETRKRSAKASTQAMRIFYKKHYVGKYPKIITFLVLLAISLLEKIREFTA